MTVDELRIEADKLGYKLQKKPSWNCQCCVSYERRLKETNGHEYCKQATYIETSKQGYTHCQREKRKRNVNSDTDPDDI